MTATQDRPTRRVAKSKSKGRHPASRVEPDGRGPRAPIGRRTPVFLVLFLMIVALVMLGVVMVLSASAVVSINESSSAWSLFRRQLMWVGVGIVAMFTTMRVDYHRWRILAVPAAIGSAVLLVFVLLPGFGVTVNDATRWIRVGPFSFQPSEVAKLAMILFVADILARPTRDIRDTRVTLRPVMAVTAVFVLLLMAQPHLGNTIILCAVVMLMLFMAGAPVANLVGIGALAGSGAAMMIMTSPWRRDRWLAFLDPWSDAGDAGYQTLQSLHAITVGGLTGVGLGASRAKFGFLPYAHTDFIFAIIAEELGLLGASAVVLLYVGIGVGGMVAALRAPDRFGMLLAVGITGWIVSQAVLNLGSVMALLPVTGVTLPFLSFGGTSLVVTMAAVGVLLNVARQGR